ncbi:DUF1778 domain-containing protein [Williamsia herbipolensis]|uniref:DUF1778 domain-containing protein n=1 Tax=Williamsia herbipolensis TaxID=1603258 RepID=A0AAU4K4P0_9NOCA|nr:DUF1778 domain-containing protein [Williamsia herbipolensis]
MTTTKTKRIELRAEEEIFDRIQRAASVVHEPASEFVRKAAAERANEILRQDLITVMEADQFDSLMASLDDAGAAPGLAAAARKPAVFKRR